MARRKKVKRVTYSIRTAIRYCNQTYATNELRFTPPRRGGYLTFFFPDGRIVGCDVAPNDSPRIAANRLVGIMRRTKRV